MYSSPMGTIKVLSSGASGPALAKASLIAVASLVFQPATVDAGNGTLTVVCGGGSGPSVQACNRRALDWGEENGVDVQVSQVPSDSSQQLALFQQMLSSRDGTFDVFAVDVVWPGLLGDHLLDLSDHVDAEILDRHFTGTVENNRVDGRLVAIPWFVDTGLLYYRTDLLEHYDVEVPESWDDLEDAALVIQEGERAAGNDRFWGYVWQGRAYEGLTCNALEWVASNGGGTIVESDGTVSIDNSRALEAVERAARWINTISPPSILNYDEEESRGAFQSGNAAFLRNWPYVYALANQEDSPIAGNVGVAPLPRGDDGQPAATLGGWSMAVNRYTESPDAAIELALHLTGPEAQKERAIEYAINPSIEDLYADPDVLATNEIAAELGNVFEYATPRPTAATGLAYNQVSNLFWNAVHDSLARPERAEQSLGDLAVTLDRIIQRQ